MHVDCHVCRSDSFSVGRFFLDRMGEELSVEDKARRSQRAQRFKGGLEGNRKYRQKVSINEMIKTVVSPATITCQYTCIRVHYDALADTVRGK